ncbi:MAG: precorrin-6A reductase [Lachnospiraceae bacterium]|nr:precorrin-6A reductase [Lachnospiraceae bacterium]
MKNIIIFSGTTEGRTLSRLLSDNRIKHFVSVATDYGEKLCPSSPYVNIKKGRMDYNAICDFFIENKIDIVIDATHPYAKEVTKNLKNASEKLNIKYMRYVRSIQDNNGFKEEAGIKYFETAKECAEALYAVSGNILLTTGSKELSCFCEDERIKKRLIARVLPGVESIEICERNGLLGRQIIAMQGPFSYDMNLLMLKQYNISCLVTKQSGRIGGFEDKYYAALDAGVSVYIIGSPEIEEGDSLSQICEELGIDSTIKSDGDNRMCIKLIGCGMGSKNQLTDMAREFIDSADIILGAKRLIEPYQARIEKKAFYLAEDIIPYLETIKKSIINRQVETSYRYFSNDELRIAVLFSGDTGFYSGAYKLYKALSNAANDNVINADIEIMPGISSVSYLASLLHETWENARIISIHGRKDTEVWKQEVYEAVSTNKKTFVLVSNAEDLKTIFMELKDRKMEDCVIYAGYQMSYENEEIIRMTSDTDMDDLKEGLYTCLIINSNPSNKVTCAGMNIYIKDEEFNRGKVPMTKQEVRCLSIAKLKLDEASVVYDIGSGTGSMAIQMAAASKNRKVYAIEKNPEAIGLIKDNCRHFGVSNVIVTEGEALSVMDELDVPTHAFIGGNGGSMKDILKKLYEKNPHMSVVINAVSTETMQLCLEIEKDYMTKDFSMVCVGITRLNQVGGHHLMRSENPIWICSFSFTL